MNCSTQCVCVGGQQPTQCPSTERPPQGRTGLPVCKIILETKLDRVPADLFMSLRDWFITSNYAVLYRSGRRLNSWANQPRKGEPFSTKIKLINHTLLYWWAVQMGPCVFHPHSTASRVSHTPILSKIGNRLDQYTSAIQVRLDNVIN